MIASISAVAVMVTYCCVFMNKNSATRNSDAAHSPGFCPLLASCTPVLMAARIDALLMPPRPDMTKSFGIEPCISRRTSCKKDITALASATFNTRRRRLGDGCACRQLLYVAASPFDVPRWAGDEQHE